MIWENLRCEEFPDAVRKAKGLCVVPVGCLERHGRHLPLGTDTICARETAIRAAELEPVVVFPTMFFGEKSGAGEFPGTVIFSVETRWQIFKETCCEIYRNGFDKILFLNGHGGNDSMLDFFARNMLQVEPRVRIFRCSTNANVKKLNGLTQAIQDERLTDEDRAMLQAFVDENRAVGHACILETAKAYYTHPHTVRLSGITEESGDNTHRFDEMTKMGISSPVAWAANFPNSYGASNQFTVNERIAEVVSEIYIADTAKQFKFLKEETISEAYLAEWQAKQKRHEFK